MTEGALMADGDAAFVKVVNRRAAHQLAAGEAASALNIAFTDGQARPRLAVALQEWGELHRTIALGTFDEDHPTSVTLTVGRRYLYRAGNSTVLSTAVTVVDDVPVPAGNTIAPGIFTATTATVYLWDTTGFNVGEAITAELRQIETPCGYGRFNDPLGQDCAVLVTDDWRDGAGEDGGRGRAWRILPGNLPQAIPLNGHDVWGTSRLIQCYNGLVLLRQGDERHYFAASAVNTSANTIQLNCAPAWNNGDEVNFYSAADGSAIPGGPNIAATYYVRTDLTNNKVTLYDTRAHAVAGGSTGRLVLASATGRFYLQRTAVNPGPFGNGAPGLLMQATPTQTAFEVGFVAASATVAVTAVTNNLFSAYNHRLIPGDRVTFTGVTWSAAPTDWYAAPQSDHTFYVYSSPENALVDDGSTGLLAASSVSSASVTKHGAAGLPLPPGREGVYYKQRLIIVNGRNNILISDPLDPLHYALYAGINANLGENDVVTALVSLGDDTLLVLKENVVLAFNGLSGNSDGWSLQEITREYGCQAPLTAVRFGADAWFGSRHGVASIALTEFGKQLGVAVPASDDIVRRFDNVDWPAFPAACAAYWNNRFFLACPFKGQADGEQTNNAVLVFNAINKGWEDLWQGASLTPAAFCRLTVAGEERLTFVNAAGLVCWFSDGFVDYDGNISTQLVTRGYFPQRALALKAEVEWETWQPSLTVKVRGAGYGEEYTAGTYTPTATKYLVDGQPDYVAATATQEEYDRPARMDYAPTADELLIGRLDAHQNTCVPFRFRVRDRAPQIVVENSQGSARINSVKIYGRPVGVLAAVES